MPTYEFRCLNCRKKFEVFKTFKEYDAATIVCTYCGSNQVNRKIGRIRVARSEDSRLDGFSETSLEGMENDPQSLGRMMRKMSSELGEEMPGEFNEVVGRLEKGESPEQIEQSMPDLGNALGDSGGDTDFD